VAGGTRASARRKGGPEAGRASLTFRSRCAHVLLTVRVYSGGAVRPSSTREAAQRHFRPILAAVRQTSSDGDVFEALASNFSRFRSASFARTLQQLRRFNRDDSTTLLLEGESGTGKTSIARWLHANSARSRYPFQHAVLSAMDDALAASDLFGHVSGAYTDAKSARAGLFTAAHGGTLFLDEIGKASLNVQQKLLHAIEYGELRPVGSDRNVRIDVRLIVATNVPLEEKVADGSFLCADIGVSDAVAATTGAAGGYSGVGGYRVEAACRSVWVFRDSSGAPRATGGVGAGAVDVQPSRA